MKQIPKAGKFGQVELRGEQASIRVPCGKTRRGGVIGVWAQRVGHTMEGRDECAEGGILDRMYWIQPATIGDQPINNLLEQVFRLKTKDHLDRPLELDGGIEHSVRDTIEVHCSASGEESILKAHQDLTRATSGFWRRESEHLSGALQEIVQGACLR